MKIESKSKVPFPAVRELMETANWEVEIYNVGMPISEKVYVKNKIKSNISENISF